MSNSIKERFLRDVAQHEMVIQLDHGAFRHVVFKRPNTICQMFSLTTSPGRLIFGGDMGCFVFERTDDMFAFFRQDIRFEPNFDYWHEKLVAVDRCGGAVKPSADRFRDNLNHFIDERDDLTAEEFDEVHEFIDEAVTLFDDALFDDECPHDAYVAVGNFELRGDQFFTDFWELSNDDYTIRYLWACHAIQWGVAQYDAHEQRLQAEPAPVSETTGGAE